MARRVKQLIDTDAYFHFNALRDGIHAAFNGMEVVQQFSRFAIEVVARFGQFNAARVAHKQHHIEVRLDSFDGVANGRGGDPQFDSSLTKT
ncbi:hypothetical protein D3C75_627620 [compost metagenome]